MHVDIMDKHLPRDPLSDPSIFFRTLANLTKFGSELSENLLMVE